MSQPARRSRGISCVVLRATDDPGLIATIRQHGQRFVDEAVLVQPVRESAIASSVREAFHRPPAAPVVVGYERVFLNWIKPGGN